MEELATTLVRIDGRGYKAYKEIQGRTFLHPSFRLIVDHIQGDPYAAPSRIRAQVPSDVSRLPPSALTSHARRRATRDFLARIFRQACRDQRDISIDAGGQTVLDRSACLIDDTTVEIRFTVNMPAAGRRILGRRARKLLCETVPRAIERAALARNLDVSALNRHCDVVEDQTVLREALASRDLVSFVATGSILPRRSGVDDRPLRDAILFETPPTLAITLDAPNAGSVTGLGLRRGINLIVGGGFHGKSTLLRAVESGVWDHIPEDGRDLVVTDPTAVKIRAEDGRAVHSVDISDFIDNLPHGTPTKTFTTDLASGSTSQAAALKEALETEASVVLLDEDTSASNFMIRDRRMQELVSKDREPITPFVDRIRGLRDELGVSTILVMGGSGDYFDHADTVIQMDSYRPRDVTDCARVIARSLPTGRSEELETPLTTCSERKLDPRSLDPERKRGRTKIQARGRDTLVFGRGEVDLRAVEQIEDPSQIRTVGWILAGLTQQGGSSYPIPLIKTSLERLEFGDWDALNGRPDGDFALPRLHEVMAALNRLRGVRMVG